MMGKTGNAYTILAGKPTKRALGRLTKGWDDNCKMGLREISCGDTRWIEDRVEWRALVLAALNLRVLVASSTL